MIGIWNWSSGSNPYCVDEGSGIVFYLRVKASDNYYGAEIYLTNIQVSTQTGSYYADDSHATLSYDIGPVYEEVAVDGITYRIFDNEAMVINGNTTYCGNIIVPEFITVGDNTYNVTAIGLQAFYNCTELTSIIIPNSVCQIDDYAFAGCSNLSEVYCLSTTPSNVSFGNSVFPSNNVSNLSLYVPSYALSDYQTSSSWQQYFHNIVEMDISMSQTSADVVINETLQLSAIVQLGELADKTLTWSTSNPAVTTVDENGLVTAVSLGTATITATTNNVWNMSAQCVVNVVPTTPYYITFADDNVKAICIQNWDTNGDGELSNLEATAVINLGRVFENNTTISSFDELSYFTGLTSIDEYAFHGCSGLTLYHTA